MVKNIALSIGLLSILAAVVIIPSNASINSCSEPLTYRVASIDLRYDISQKQLIDIMKEVETLWSAAVNKPLIKFSENGDIAIHLIYSDSQHKSRQEQKLSGKIDIRRQQVSMLKQQYERLSGLYKKKKDDLKRLLEKHKRMVDELNDSVPKWRKHGISESEERNFKKKKRQISNLEYRIDQQYSEIESLRKRLNQKTERLNELTGQTNELISVYNKEFAETRKFHQGRYVQKGDLRMIKIFQFNNQKELRLVLAHEIGHALGLNHVENTESVMYYLMDKQNIYDLALTKQDVKALRNLCGTLN